MNIRSGLLATVSTIALISSAAAADFDGGPAIWKGAYAGLHAGAGRASFAITENDEGGSVGGSKTGAVAGAQIGYNWQAKHFVYGLEADASFGGLKDTVASGSGTPPSSTTISNVNWLASLRGRAGIALDDTLLYATGGLALGGVKNGWGSGYTAPRGTCCDVSSSRTRVGFVVGGGIEHMISEKMSIKGEALYYDLGSSSTALNDGSGLNMTASNQVIVGRAGLNLKW